MTLFSADDAALILDVATAAAHWGDYLEDQDRSEELLVLDEQLLAVHVLVKRLGKEIPILLEAYEALAASRLNAGVILDVAGHVDEWMTKYGACILTPENIGTEDDCTTHGHELLNEPYYGHCDTCGTPCDAGGCLSDQTHQIALD